MMDRKLSTLAWTAPAVLVLFLLAACGNGDENEGLSRAEVEEIVREEVD